VALLGELRCCYATPSLRLLSCWWVLGALAGSYCENYGTNLFFEVDPSSDENGHVTFVTRSLCCAAALAAIRAEAAAARCGAGVYAAGTAVAGLALASLAGATRLLSAYASYAVALTALQFCTCVLYAQCAHALDDAATDTTTDEASDAPFNDAASVRRRGAPRGRVAVLFGANATAALALQTAVQAAAEAIRAPPRTQFALLAWCASLCFLCCTANVASDAMACIVATRLGLRRPRRWRAGRCGRGWGPGASCARAPRRCRCRPPRAWRRGSASWTRCCHRPDDNAS